MKIIFGGGGVHKVLFVYLDEIDHLEARKNHYKRKFKFFFLPLPFDPNIWVIRVLCFIASIATILLKEKYLIFSLQDTNLCPRLLFFLINSLLYKEQFWKGVLKQDKNEIFGYRRIRIVFRTDCLRCLWCVVTGPVTPVASSAVVHLPSLDSNC